MPSTREKPLFFLAEVFGIHLGSIQLLTAMIMVVVASIGISFIPGVGLVVFFVILESVGIPTTGIALILGVYRILDMSRPAVNVTCDLETCKVINRLLGGKPEKNSAETASKVEEHL